MLHPSSFSRCPTPIIPDFVKTADERPCSSIENPVVIDQVHQSIYHALGIHPETEYTIEGRPFYTTPDGHGKPILDLFGKPLGKST